MSPIGAGRVWLRARWPDIARRWGTDGVEKQTNTGGWDPVTGPGGVQLPLIPGVPPRHVRTRHRPPLAVLPSNDALLASFQRRVEALGCTRKTARDYTSQMRTLLRIAHALHGEPIDLITLFGHTQLLGRSLAYSARPNCARQFSGYALDGRRHAARKFALVFDGELHARHGASGERLLDRALQSAYRRVGSTYRLPVSLPWQRGGPVLTPAELERLLKVVAAQPSFAGPRDFAAFLIMAETGCRIDALRRLHAAMCFEEPDGRIRLMVHAEGRREPAEYLLSRHASQALSDAINAFNREAPRLGRADWIRLGSPGPVWRSTLGVVSADAWRRTLASAGAAAGLPRLRPHDLRRTFATQAESRVGRYQTSLAGGWDGSGTMDRHYVSPRWDVIDAKMGQAPRQTGVVAVPTDARTLRREELAVG